MKYVKIAGKPGEAMSTSLPMLVFFLISFAGIVNCLRNFRTDFLEEWPTPGTGPHFDTSMPSNFTGLVGKTVHLVCKVKNLGNRTVSWIRHRDIHLLTVGRYTYTSDQRFEALHSPHTEEWTLRIRYPQRRDTGIYECQISTTPPIGHLVHLTIVEPITNIVGAPELFVNKGSTINLTCLVRYAPEPPPMMIWSHNTEVAMPGAFSNFGDLEPNARTRLGENVERAREEALEISRTRAEEINFDSPRGGISLVTEKGPETSSRLMIQKAVPADSGVYTCGPSNANPSSIRVHVVNEEHPAAMHHGDGSTSYGKKTSLYFLMSLMGSLIFV